MKNLMRVPPSGLFGLTSVQKKCAHWWLKLQQLQNRKNALNLLEWANRKQQNTQQNILVKGNTKKKTKNLAVSPSECHNIPEVTAFSTPLRARLLVDLDKVLGLPSD